MGGPTKQNDPTEKLAEAVLTGQPLTAAVETESNITTTALVTEEDVQSAGSVKVQAIARLLVLLITIINEALNTLGIYASLPVNQGIVDIASLVLVSGAAIWCYWKNNSWTPEANLGDNVMNALKKSDLSVSDVFTILAKASKK